MPAVPERAYRFSLESHWRAGVRRGLRVRGDRLVVPSAREIRSIPGTGPHDGGSFPVITRRGRILWLRPETGEVLRWRHDDGPVVGLGTLDGSVRARRLVAGRSLLWTVTDVGLLRHDAATGQRLGAVAARPGWRISDAAGDGGDGVWVAEVDDAGRWRIRRLDCWGRSCDEPIALEGVTAERLAVVLGAGDTSLIAVDPEASTELIVVDLRPDDIRTVEVLRVALEVGHHSGRTMLARGPDGAVHVMTVPGSFGRGDRSVLRQLVDPESGSVEDHQVMEVPRSLGRPTSLAGQDEALVLGGTRGLAELVTAPTALETRQVTFISPALVSPPQTRSGWDRAEIDAELPAGTTMEITWAATSELWVEDWAAQLRSGSPTPENVAAMEQRLPWQAAGIVHRGSDGPAATRAALLHRAEGTHLWLRVDLRIAAGSRAPELTGLRVHYPNLSYVDHLPAIYRENTHSVDDLRQILAPYEVLLEGIDETLDRLPDRMDPASADDEWSDYLLGWLGFPPLGGLDADRRQRLLAGASELLQARGTRAGLEKLLEIVTDGRYTLTDSSEASAGWFLGGGTMPSVGAGPSRLGVDTVLLGLRPQPPRAGTLVLGDALLGRVCPDPAAMISRIGRMVTITLHVGADRGRLEPVMERLLDTFVPAHCRVRLHWTAAPEAPARRLDVDFRLGADDVSGAAPKAGDDTESLLDGEVGLRLGDSTRLGRWGLPARTSDPAALDHGPRLGTGWRLL